jgi:zinc transporter ZupT
VLLRCLLTDCVLACLRACVLAQAHKSLAGFALGTSLLRGGTSPTRFVVVGGAFASASPCGALLSSAGAWLLGTTTFAPVVIGLSAGTFLYVGVVELLAKELAAAAVASATNSEGDGDEVAKLVLFLVGWGAMALLALWT